MTARPHVSVIMPHAVRHAADDLSAFARHVEDTGLDGAIPRGRLSRSPPSSSYPGTG
jgi:hypothetical protein